jgi:hypothetical protein
MGGTVRALSGAAGGVGGTVVLSVLRSVLRIVGVVYKTNAIWCNTQQGRERKPL